MILGMHRSGTTVIAELARAMGLALGKVTELMELQPLVDLNEWLLRRSGGSWEHPAAALDMLAAPELRSEAQAQVDAFARRHLGARLGADGAGPWGWKEPRMGFTLPLWEGVFPRMRLLVVRRHGFDAALSLRARARAEVAAGRTATRRLPPKVRLRNLALRREEQPARSVRCLSLRGSLSLWGEYNRQLDTVLATTPHPTHQLRLEDLLEDPRPALADVAAFIGLERGGALAEQALGRVPLRDASRADEHHLVAAEAQPEDLALLASYGYRGAEGAP